MGNPHLPTHNQNINTEEIEEINPFIAKQRNFGGKGEHKGLFSADDAANSEVCNNAQSTMHCSV